MTSTLDPVTHAAPFEPVAPVGLTRVGLLDAVFTEFRRHGVPACITHNHSNLDVSVESDVDCVISPSFGRRKLYALLAAMRVDGKPVRVVQWFDDGAQYIAIAAGTDRSPVMVQLHVSSAFELDGRTYFTADELVAAVQTRGVLPVSPPAIEFACVLLNRIHKADLADRHARRLTELYATDPEGCVRQARRFWSKTAAELLLGDAQSGDWTRTRNELPRLAAEMRCHAVGPRLADRLAASGRKISRWLRPRAGLHVVFLGPDGVGKSTVIEQVREAIKPAFLGDSYHTFAPSLIPHKFQPDKPTPHALPPRGFGASMVKAAWWSVCYTAGYAATIRPERVRGNIAINHRYLLDAIVDPKRYRYSGPTWLLKMIWAVSPKPDLVFLLNAPAEVIQARKKEVPFEETARQVNGYRTLLDGAPYGRVINAARPLDEVVGEVNAIVLNYLADRVKHNVSKGDHA